MTEDFHPLPDRDDGIWSVSCFYVHGSHKRRGVAGALLEAAVETARKAGARMSYLVRTQRDQGEQHQSPFHEHFFSLRATNPNGRRTSSTLSSYLAHAVSHRPPPLSMQTNRRPGRQSGDSRAPVRVGLTSEALKGEDPNRRAPVDPRGAKLRVEREWDA